MTFKFEFVKDHPGNLSENRLERARVSAEIQWIGGKVAHIQVIDSGHK